MLITLSTLALAGDLRESARKHRPANLAEGAAWTQLWVDKKTTSNTATPLAVKLDPSMENGKCNGLDDDSNGKIDEKCGLETGAFQAVVSWDNHADIDIEVFYSPWENTSHSWARGKVQVTYGYGDSPMPEHSLGDGRDAPVLKIQENRRGSCSPMEEGEKFAAPEHYVENAFVAGDKAPPGIYTIKFYNHGFCQGRPIKDQVTVNVAVAVNGKLVGHFLSGDLGEQNFSYPIMHVYVP